MDKILAVLKRRLAERSSRVSLVTGLVVAAVVTGLVSMDQLDGFLAKVLGAVAAAQTMVSVLVPDPEAGVDPDAVAEAAEMLAKRAPGYDRVRDGVDQVSLAARQVLDRAGVELPE